MRKRLTYSNAGVNIKKADKLIEKLGLKTKNKAFASIFSLHQIIKRKNIKYPVLVSSSDGVGTKIKIAQLLDQHYSIGIDLVAMNVNDIICLGAQPLFFLDYIACGKLIPRIFNQIMKGIKNGLKQANCQLIGGETAEMPGVYKGNEYDLAGFCVGIIDMNKLIDNKKIKENDVIIGISSSGIHSNGFSLVRKVFSQKEIISLSKKLLTPTRIYVNCILSLLKTPLRPYINGIAHITGGAFFNKAIKIIPKGLGMRIYTNSWKIPEIFSLIQEKGNITKKEMFTVLNMGIGMIVITNSKYADRVKNHIDKFYKSFVIGKIIKSSKKLELI